MAVQNIQSISLKIVTIKESVFYEKVFFNWEHFLLLFLQAKSGFVAIVKLIFQFKMVYLLF